MTVLTRRQFRQHWESVMPGLGEDDSVLWALEEHNNKKCRWFVCVRPLATDLEWLDGNWKHDYWLWCNRNCAGQTLCYSSDHENQEEWWGFSHRADIHWWLMRWSS